MADATELRHLADALDNGTEDQIDLNTAADALRKFADRIEQEKPRAVMQPVGRMGDMAPPGRTHMTVMLDADGDACVSIWDQENRTSGQLAEIEFCTSFGGGRSPRTRAALVLLMTAMEQDNAECPSKQWPPQHPSGVRVNALPPTNPLAKGRCLHGIGMGEHCAACAAEGTKP